MRIVGGGSGQQREEDRKAGLATQITYGGKPLFWCTKDKAPGDVKGNVSDKFGKWTAVVTAKASSGGGSTSTTNAGTGGAAF